MYLDTHKSLLDELLDRRWRRVVKYKRGEGERISSLKLARPWLRRQDVEYSITDMSRILVCNFRTLALHFMDHNVKFDS